MNTPWPDMDSELLDVLHDDPGLVSLAHAIVAVAPQVRLSDSGRFASAQLSGGSRRGLGLALRRTGERVRAARLSIVSAVFLALVVVLAPVAFALRSQIVDLITGKPAPPSVVDSLSAWNRMLGRAGAVPTGAFGRSMQAVADQAAGVFSLQTPDGRVDLWAAPEVGGGKCFVLAINDGPADPPSDFRAIGSCDSQLPRFLYSNPGVAVPWPVSFGEMPDVALVLVRVFRAAQVEIQLSEGKTMPLRIVDGFGLAAIPPNLIPPGNRQPITVVARDDAGKIIANDPLLYSRSVF